MPNGSFGSEGTRCFSKVPGTFEKVAHRGASAEAPENTLPAFELAFNKYRSDRVEMDLRLARDGVPVVFHDETLERVTNGCGRVRGFSLHEIQSLDAGFRFDPRGRGEFPFRGKGVKISTLEEILAAFPGGKFFLEIKDRGPEIGKKILEALRRSGRNQECVVGSFHGPTMRAFRRLAGNTVETFLAEDEVILAQAAFRLGWGRVKLSGRFASLPRTKYGFSLDGPRWIEFLHRKGVRVYYWTMNEVSEMKELIRRGADGILTDYPDRLQSPAT